MKLFPTSLLPFLLGSIGAGSILLSALALRTGEACAEPLVFLGLLSAPALLIACAGLGGGRGEWPRIQVPEFSYSAWTSPANFYRWCLLGTILVSLVCGVWVVWVGAPWIAASSWVFRGLLGLGGFLASVLLACLSGLPLSSGRKTIFPASLTGSALAVTGLAWSGAWIRLLLILRPEPEATLGASRLDNVILWLLLLALALWGTLDRRRFPSALSDQNRIIFWMGLVLGFAIPLLLLDRGGRLAEAGALLVLTGSLSTVRTALPR